MTANPRLAILLSLLLFCIFSAASDADEPATTQPASQHSSQQSPAKWRYTLLNPVPPAQLRGMDTDRPNVTNTPHTIDAGHLQVETGLINYSYDRTRFSGTTIRSDDFAVIQSNFRLGVLNNLEINAVIDPYQIDRTHDEGDGTTIHARGFGDAILGAKLNLWGNEGSDGVWESALAIQPQFKFPTAGNGLGNGHFEFALEFPFLLNLPAGFHLGLQPGVSMERNTSDNGDVAAVQNSISIDRVVWNKLDAYLEYASDVTAEKHVEAVQSIDVGGTYPLNDSIVVDAGAAFGLNNATNNIELLAGMSFRF